MTEDSRATVEARGRSVVMREAVRAAARFWAADTAGEAEPFRARIAELRVAYGVAGGNLDRFDERMDRGRSR